MARKQSDPKPAKMAKAAKRRSPCTPTAHWAATVDLMTQRLNIHERAAWILRSLLQ